MKKTFTTTLLSMALLSSACSHNFLNRAHVSVERSLANEAELPYSVEDFFTFKGSTQINKEKNYLESIKLNETLVKFSFIEDPKMPNDIAYRVQPEIIDQVFTVKIFHSKMAGFDQHATIELVMFMASFTSQKFFSPYSFFEIYYNALRKDLTSLIVLAKLRGQVFAPPPQYTAQIFVDFYEKEKEQKAIWDGAIDELQKIERVHNKTKKIQANNRKAVMDALDKAHDDLQFRSLVANNDRKGAVKLLRDYLPWEEMSPFEKSFWETHLKVMSDPVPLEQRILLYRGIDDDIIQVAKTAGKQLSRDEAVLEKKVFLMSTMLTKNQGTWNRRLRSLTAMNDKFIGQGPGETSEYTKATRVTNMFTMHSKEPKGSPYLSLTPHFRVANNFGQDKVSAYFIDPRLAYYNFTSLFASEIEFLLPLTTFPDDLAGIVDVDLHKITNHYNKPTLIEQVKETLKSKYGAAKGAEVFQSIAARTDKYIQTVGHGMGGTTRNPKLAVGDKNMVTLYRELVNVDSTKAAKIISENKDLTCLDLIQAFW